MFLFALLYGNVVQNKQDKGVMKNRFVNDVYLSEEAYLNTVNQ